jgi:hypothetical protein
MNLKDNLPLQCFLTGMVILVLFIGGDMGQGFVNRAGGWEMAFRTIAGTLPRYYGIENGNSGKIMDVYSAATSDDVNIIQWTNKNGSNQLWELVSAGSGYYKIRNKNSGKFMDVRGGSTADGALIVQYAANGGDSQLWQKIDTGSGYFKLKNKRSGKFLDVQNASREDGANIIQRPEQEGTSQLWKFN